VRLFASQPLFPFVLTFAIGIWLNLALGLFSPIFFLLVPLCLLLAAVAFAVPRLGAKAGLTFALLAVFLAGSLNLEKEKQRLEAGDSLLPFLDQGRVRILGRLAEPADDHPGYTSLVIEAQQIWIENKAHPVAGNVRMNVNGDEPLDFIRGDRLVMVAQLRRPQSFRNPGGFQYGQYLARRGIAVIGTVHGADEIYRLPAAGSWNFLRGVDQVRKKLASLIAENAPEGGPLLRALLLGEQSAVPEEVYRGFRNTGLAHLLSVSGLHLGLVAGMGFLLFRYLFGLSPWLMVHFNIHRLAGLLTFALVLGYALLAGASVPTMRSLIMVGVYVGAIMLGRVYQLWNSLWLALLLILLVWPSALFEASLQLSFAAVMGIFYLLPRLWLLFPQARRFFLPDPLQEPIEASFLRRSPFWKFGLYIVNLVFVSLAAQFGVAVLVAVHFHQFNPFSVLHNLAAVPAVELGLIPPGLMVCLVALVSPALGAWLFQLLDPVAVWVDRMVESFSAWPGCFLLVRPPSPLEVVLLYGFAVLGLEWLIQRQRGKFSWELLKPDIQFRDPFGVEAVRSDQPVSPGKRRVLFAGALLCLGLLLALLLGRLVSGRLDRDLRLTALDVGAGQSLLLELPDHSRLLIDGGGFYRNIFDIGANVVAPYLLGRGIHSLDAVVLTHPHPDHGNGLTYLLEYFRVGEFWLTADRNFLTDQLLEIADRREIPTRILDDQTPVLRLGEVTLQVLHPPPGPAGLDTDLNDHSLALLVRFRRRSVLIPTDMSSRVERQLVKKYGEALHADVLIAPHHGSKSSSSPEFLDAVRPAAALFSARSGGFFQMPHPLTLKKYQERGIKIFRTDLLGAITVRTDGESLKIEPAGSPEAGEVWGQEGGESEP